MFSSSYWSSNSSSSSKSSHSSNSISSSTLSSISSYESAHTRLGSWLESSSLGSEYRFSELSGFEIELSILILELVFYLSDDVDSILKARLC